MKTKVKFRILGGEVIAFFPGEKWDYNGLITSYMHIGQHGGASPSLMRNKKATPEEYAPLLAELTSIGYDLQVLP